MVDRADINSVLMQLREVREQVKATQPSIEHIQEDRLANEVAQVTKTSKNFPDIPADPNVPNFQSMFANAINNVNAKQRHAGELRERFEKGDPQIDLPEVMIAAQKASVSFQAMTEVRNKLVEAYKDIMNMPV